MVERDKFVRCGTFKTHDEFADVTAAIADNSILANVQALLVAQTAKGIAKYGHTVTPDALSLREWIDHAQQEAMDHIVYLEVLKARLADDSHNAR